jgi:C4-dicarboxylate-specific signal transduction histidine kinase
MSAKLETAAETGLQFFGKMSASISHEIKNVLAVINENAGLLEDFTLMAERGVPLDNARLKKLAATVMNHVSRGDGIIKKMNRLAHSIDETVATVELAEIIKLFVSLTDRLTVMRSVAVEPKLPESNIKIKTSPFLLLNLLWLCLEFAMDAGAGTKRIELVAERTGSGLTIRFKIISGLSGNQTTDFPSERAISLLGLLEADLTVDPAGEEILLKLPENIC